MNKTQRIKSLQIALALTLTASIALTGCGKTSAGKADGTPGSTTGGTSSNDLKPYVIDWYTLPPSGPQADQELIDAEVNKIIQPKINATVKTHALDWATYEPKMQALVATGEKIDLCWTASWKFNYAQNAAKGAFADITDLIPKYAPNAYKILATGWLDAAKVNGKVYGMACNKEKGIGISIYANKNLLDKYHLDISNVNSLEDVEPLLKAMKEKDPGSAPLSTDYQLPYRDLYNTTDVYTVIMKADGSGYVCELDLPNFIQGCKTMRKYYNAGYIQKDYYTLKDDGPNVSASKRLLWFSATKPYAEVQVSNQTGIPVVVHQIGKPLARQSDMTGSMMAVGSTSQDPQRVLMFYDMFYSDPKLVNLYNFGIEGKHYVMTGDNSIDFAPGTDNGKKSGYNPQNQWQIGNQFLTYLQKGEAADKWKKFEQFNNDCELAPALGFNPSYDQIKTQVAAINNLKDQYLVPLLCGASDYDTVIPKYKEKLKEAGIDTVLANLNKQYADWKAANGK